MCYPTCVRRLAEFPGITSGRLCTNNQLGSLSGGIPSAGGHAPGRDSNGVIPVASAWGDPNSQIQGYTPVSVNDLRPGEIISDGNHVGVVAPYVDGSGLGTISASAHTNTVVQNYWGFRPGPGDDRTAAWRCLCDMQFGP